MAGAFRVLPNKPIGPQPKPITMKTTTILATSWRRSKMKLPTCFCLLGLLSAQVVHGELVDVFIATGQSNATWPNDTYEFGQGVQA
jgi:hypothetical protein